MRLNANRFGITAVVAILIISVVGGGTVAATTDDAAVSPDDISVTTHGVDAVDDLARFEISNDADQDVTLSYTSERENGTVTIDAQSSENLTIDVPEYQGGEITLTKDGTTYAEAREDIIFRSDLGPTNPTRGKVDIEAVRYDEEDALIEYKIVNENDRPVDGELSHSPINADDNSITVPANGEMTVTVDENSEPVGNYFNESARQLDFFETAEDVSEPGHPVPSIASGELTDETPREDIDPSDGSDGSDRDKGTNDSNGADDDDGSDGKSNCGCDAKEDTNTGSSPSNTGGATSDSSDGNAGAADTSGVTDTNGADDENETNGTSESDADTADESPGFGVLIGLASSVSGAVLAGRRLELNG